MRSENEPLNPVLDGMRVLDLSDGIAGPMAAMLLADQGADVLRIEPPASASEHHRPGHRVFNRGKRTQPLDLRSPDDRRRFLRLCSDADILIESCRPGVTRRLGIDYHTVRRTSHALVYVSITAYGSSGSLACRPAHDGLVAARTGLHWEQRGWAGGNLHRLAHATPPLPDIELPVASVTGPNRPGPIFSASAWPSIGAALLAVMGASAALLVREGTGHGQLVETTLLQGALAATAMTWQRVEDPDAPDLWSWVFDGRSPKGFFRCADGRWVQQWVQRPSFILQAAGRTLTVPEGFDTTRHDPDRLGMGPEDLLTLLHLQPLLADQVARFSSRDWERVAARAGVPLQPVRSPEEALRDPDFLADGCVAEVTDPELGTLRQFGLGYRLTANPTRVRVAGRQPPPARSVTPVLPQATAQARTAGAPPLHGVTVLDLGVAVAGPFGTQLLADLGADVIKVNSRTDGYWAARHIAFSCSRGKRSLAVDLKHPDGRSILHRLVARADVIHHNMRLTAAQRLGADYQTLAAINPGLIYCHVRGFERGPRQQLPGNDQMAAALCGPEWEDGGCAAGGSPIWSLVSLGDTGAGLLSAIAVLQALLHRDRTGQGQFVDTSIVAACLLNVSHTYADRDGKGPDRPTLDRDLFGFGALHRLYETSDGWLCIVVPHQETWLRLQRALNLPQLRLPRYRTAQLRGRHDAELAAVLARCFATRPAADWVALLDSYGVPAEVCSPDFATGLFDDPEFVARGWVTTYRRAGTGRIEQFGKLVDFSDTPQQIGGPPLVVGQDTRAILTELGYRAEEVDALLAARIVVDACDATPGDPAS